MASKVINTILNLKDKFSPTLKKTEDNTKNFKRRLYDANNEALKMKRGIEKAFKGIAAAAGTFLAAKGVVDFSKQCVAAINAQIRAETKLETVFKATGKASLNEVNSLKAYASELQGIGVIGDEVTLNGMQQLATFNLSADSIKTLSGGMLDLAAQTKGVNASQEDMIPIANMIGKAMTGQTGALSRVGVTFTDAQERILKTGNEMEKAAALADVLKQNFGGVNKALAATTEGSLQQWSNAWGDFKEELGRSLLPMLGRLAGFLGKNITPKLSAVSQKVQEIIPPILAKIQALAEKGFSLLKKAVKGAKKNVDWLIPTLAGAGSALAAFAIIGPLASKMHKFAEATKELTLAQKMATLLQNKFNTALLKNPITWIAVLIGILVGTFIYAYKHSEKFRNKVDELMSRLKEFAAGLVSTVAPAVKAIGGWFKEHVLPVLSAAKEAFLLLWNKVLAPLGNFLAGVLAPIFQSVFENMWIQVSVAFETIKGVIEAVLKVFRGILTFISGVFTGNWSKAWNGIKTIFSGIWDGIKALAKAPLLWIEKKIEALRRKVSSFAESVKDIPILGSVANWASKKIGGKALGTPYFSGGLTHINERGGEIINLPGGTQIIPHDISKKAVGGNSVTVSVTVQGNVIGNQEFMEQMGNYLVKRIQAAAAVC